MVLSHIGSKTYLLLSSLHWKQRVRSAESETAMAISLFSYLALHRGRSRRWFCRWCHQILFSSLHKALLCSQTRNEGCLAGVQSPLRHQQCTKDEKSSLLISLKMLILVVMGFFWRESVDWFFFYRVDRVNSEYQSSHPSPTDSKPSLRIKCIWYRTRRGRHRGGYNSAESYRTRPIFWTLSWTLKGYALFSVSTVDDMTTSKQGDPFLLTMDDITTAFAKSKLVKPSSSRSRPTKAICITVGIVLLAAVVVMMIIGFIVFEVKDPIIAVGSISPKDPFITVGSISPKDPVITIGFISLKGYPLWLIHS